MEAVVAGGGRLGRMGRPEAEELRLLLKRVTAMQACVRGYLVRKRFRCLKGEYENIVKEIEGNLDWLQWENRAVPKPVFLSKSVQKSIKMKALSGQEAKSDRSKSQEHEQKLCCQEELLPEKECACKMQLPKQIPVEVAALAEEDDLRQNPKYLESEPAGNSCRVLAEDDDGKEPSSVSSEWSSTILGMGSPRLSQELYFQKRQEIPEALPDLQHYRKHLAMELLWLQQAIVSRKNYLILKQRLGSSE